MRMRGAIRCSLLALVVLTWCDGEEEVKWSLVEETCKRTPYSELCVTSLESSPGIKDVTDVRGVAQIMMGIVLAKAAETLEAIRAVLKSGGSEAAVEKSLAYCAELYIPVVKYTLPQAIDALTGGHFGFANYGISDAAKQASACAKTISSGVDSLLADQNELLGRLSQIAASIVHLLLQPLTLPPPSYNCDSYFLSNTTYQSRFSICNRRR